MLGDASIVGFVPVREMAAAEAFYRGKLGLSVLERGPFALVVRAANGTTIRCALTPEFTPQQFTILGWDVPNIQEAVAGLCAAGIAMLRYPYFEQDEDGVWAVPGGAAKVAWFNDPDGNILSVAEQVNTGAAL